MELDEFVHTTLRQIMEGVQAAQRTAVDLGATVNPRHGAGTFGTFHAKSGTYVQNVEFDVALTVDEGRESGAALRVGVAWIGAGVESGSDRRSSTANRVRFTVPLLLPRQ